MTANKVIAIILGILVMVAGCYMMFRPGLTTNVLIVLASIAMIVEGIGGICFWNDERKKGFKDTWTLVGAIVSIVLGLIVLCGFWTKIILATVVIYFIAAWLLIVGVLRIVCSLKIRQAIKTAQIPNPRISWGWILFAGILLVVCGVLSFICPLALAGFITIMFAISIIASGCSLFVAGLAA